ncbi:MAG TPA: hypothetical protein VF707_04910 [Ardenticatenaceae bacterium]
MIHLPFQRAHWLKFGILLFIVALFLIPTSLPSMVRAQAQPEGNTPRLRYRTYLPMTTRARRAPTPPPTPTPLPTPTLPPTPPPLDCNVSGTSYGTLSIEGSPTDRPAEVHADLNLALRGYERTSAPASLIDYGGATDSGSPQLYGLFSDRRTPQFSSAYRVYNWDWDSNSRGGLISQWPVTLLGMATQTGEVLNVPDRANGDIGFGYKVLVLYASENRITLKYTREDNVIRGYTLHVENVCVEPDLLALYRQMNAQKRVQLPALYPGQAFGRASNGEIGVAIRDAGSFMDPRSRKDWWQGR